MLNWLLKRLFGLELVKSYGAQVLAEAAEWKPPVLLRVWRLGSLEHNVYPSQEAINRLAELLMNRPEGQDMDLIWGPELDVMEFRGTGNLNVVTGPNIKVTKDGNVVRIETRTVEDTGEMPDLPFLKGS
jgi:hypothetical protein